MINQIVTFIIKLIITVIQKTGYLGIFGLLAAESAMIPITSLITLPFIGFLVSQGSFNIYLSIIAATLGSLSGALLSFSLGYVGKDLLIRELIKKYGKYILISISDLEKAERWFRKYGEKIIFFARLIPVVKMFISLPAGIAKMKPRKFVIFTFLGSLTWSTIMIYVGVNLGNRWRELYVYYRKFEIVVIAAFVGLAVFYISHKIRKFRKTA